MKTQILAARARVSLLASTPAQMDQLRDQLNDPDLFGIINNLYMSDALKFEQVRVTQTSPAYVVVLRVSPASDGGQDDSGLNEDALGDLGKFVEQGRRRLSGFWMSLAPADHGPSFTITLGADE